ncbi:MAG: Sec-independent protein translocase protein TatB, partial [Rhizobiaceae bacterium]
MLEVGWSEMLVIAIVMIVVVGPKDLPRMLRTFGRTTAKLRTMAGDFQKQFNEALQEAELDDVKKSVDSLRSLNPAAEIRKQLNPFEKTASDVRAGLDNMMKPQAPKSAEPDVHPAEPLKNGATEMPGTPGPTAMPEPPKLDPSAPPPPTSAAEARQAAAAAALKAAMSKPETPAPVEKPKAAKPSGAPAKPAAKPAEKPKAVA